MTDNIPNIDVSTVLADWQARCREHARLSAEVLPGNKTALFDALAHAGITSVLVEFDGYGDSGQIENIDAVAGDAPIELPSTQIELATPKHDGNGVEHATFTVRDAIERLAYDFLEETHGGWEDNDGAYGDFTFDVAKRTITLAFNERHMESDHHERVF